VKHLNRWLVFSLDLGLTGAGVLLSLRAMSLLAGGDPWGRAALLMIPSVVLSATLFLLTGSYRTSIRFSTLREADKIFWLLVAKAPLMTMAALALAIFDLPRAVVYSALEAVTTGFLMIFARSLMVNLYYGIVQAEDTGAGNVLIYGTGGNAPLVASRIMDELSMPYRVKGFLERGGEKKGEEITIRGLKIYHWNGDQAALESMVLARGVTHILFTDSHDFNRERDNLVDFCIANNIRMLMGGEIQSLANAKVLPQRIKPIEIEDLLYREEIKTNEVNVARQMEGKTVLVTGAAGSIGRGITLRLLQFNVRRMILLDHAETPLHDLEMELGKKFPGRDIVFVLGDVRSRSKLGEVFESHRPDYVFHAAAYKHVPVVEQNPCEGILTNVWGTVNTAHWAVRTGVEKFVMISTDKAVNPTNVMGATKRIAELWVRGLACNASDTRFIVTRFGNVLGSNGSVIPIFREQIASGGPVTVTHPDMTRYFMTIPEACRLVLQATAMGSGGEIFVFDMGQQVKIDNLARRMILLSGFVPDEDIMVEYTGLRPGEKLYEELLSEAEASELTRNEKIRIVTVEAIDSEEIKRNVRALVLAAHRGDASGSVRMMKGMIPEFKSNNSRFETLDSEKRMEVAYGG
jgi:FlaA1/EpsC-like NDP-sugar epimerase